MLWVKVPPAAIVNSMKLRFGQLKQIIQEMARELRDDIDTSSIFHPELKLFRSTINAETADGQRVPVYFSDRTQAVEDQEGQIFDRLGRKLVVVGHRGKVAIVQLK